MIFPKKLLVLSNRGLESVPPNVLATVPTLDELYLDGNLLENVTPLAKAIDHLHVLNLYGNRLKEAPFANVKIDELYLGRNQLTKQGLAKLFPTLTKKLYLSNNQITDDGLDAIVQGLKNNHTVSHLSLHHNKIKTIQPLIDILDTTSISSLDLQGNLIDDESAQALSNTRVWDIDLSDNLLTNALGQKIFLKI